MKTGNVHFDRMVEMGNPVGEVIGVNKFLVTVRGLNPINSKALVMFSDGSKGFVHHILPDRVLVLHLGDKELQIGTIAVKQHDELVTKVGKDFIGRVVSVTGNPLDGKGPIAADAVWPVYNTAPPIYTREQLKDQLETGVTILDTIFPIVRGQRMAILGDGKTGKSTVATQLAINQKNTDIIVVYCMIAKRRSDVDELLTRLADTDSLKKAIVVVATMFESLIMSYIAPYVACAMAEFLWQQCDTDTMIIYDDLTSHAQAHREVALLSNVSPGRDSYPGDMFYAHSSLLERAGRLKRNHKTLTSLPLVLSAGGDITAYLPTNIMSITDGQWILDMNLFRDGKRPAISTGLSVTRVGGVGQSDRQHKQANATVKALASHRVASEYAHFGSELGVAAKKDLAKGDTLYELLNQGPSDTFSFMEQQLMFDIVLNAEDVKALDVKAMKKHVKELSSKVTDDSKFDQVRDMLKQMSLLEAKPGEAAKPGEPAAAAPAADDKLPEGTKAPKPASEEEKLKQDEEEVKKLTEKDGKDDKKDDSSLETPAAGTVIEAPKKEEVKS